ncbi:hypothetical protein C8J57DRAFT_1247831 [Mycena rebaudengoi]|nr:hypothetical protein C8J57DRAFT_1247831 [Mycena rebaudengoi]
MASQSSRSSSKTPPAERASISRRTQPPDKPMDANHKNTGRAPSIQDLRTNRPAPYPNPRNAASREAVTLTPEPTTPKKTSFRARFGAAAAAALGRSPNDKTRLETDPDSVTNHDKTPTQQRSPGQARSEADEPTRQLEPIRYEPNDTDSTTNRSIEGSIYGEEDMDIEGDRGTPIAADTVEALARQIQTSLTEAVQGLRKINAETNGNAWCQVSEETKKCAEEVYVGAHGTEWIEEILHRNKEDAIETTIIRKNHPG